MTVSDAADELKRLLATLNEARQFKYSAEISTNSKGEMQISAKVRCDDFQTEITELGQFVSEVIRIGNKNGLLLPNRNDIRRKV